MNRTDEGVVVVVALVVVTDAAGKLFKALALDEDSAPIRREKGRSLEASMVSFLLLVLEREDVGSLFRLGRQSKKDFVPSL